MIAFPVKTEKENAALNPSFCKSKYFAFFDGENVVIEKNDQTCGGKIVGWLASKGVKQVILRDIGGSPYRQSKNHGLELFYSGDERIEIPQVIEKIKNDEFVKMDAEFISKIVAKHEEKHHKDGHHHHHDAPKHDHEYLQGNPLSPMSNQSRLNFGKRGN